MWIFIYRGREQVAEIYAVNNPTVRLGSLRLD